MVRTRLTTLVAIFASAFGILALPASAGAASNCSGAQSNLFDVVYTSTANTTGTSAIISTEYPSLCAGANTFSTMWTMITNDNATAGWAQTGYIRDKDHLNGALSGFSQYLRTTSDTTVTKYFGGPAINSIHSYQSYVLGTAVVLYIDANRVDTTNFDPAAYWGPQPWSSQFAGETGHCQTDVAGLSSDKVHFTQAKIKQGASWVNSPDVHQGLDCGTKYAQWIIANTTFDLWTAKP